MITISLTHTEVYLSTNRYDIMEVLSAILTHEKIPYTVGVGLQGKVFCITLEYEKKLRLALLQWRKATRDMFIDMPEDLWIINGR